MATKNLVDLCESGLAHSDGDQPSAEPTSNSTFQAQLDGSKTLPPPRPARFLKREDRQNAQSDPLLPQLISIPVLSDLELNASASQGDAFAFTNDWRPGSSGSTIKFSTPPFLPSQSTIHPYPAIPPRPRKLSSFATVHTYPPGMKSLTKEDSSMRKTISCTTNTNSGHDPIPAPVVFARSSVPLYLPRLDAYLSSRCAPTFVGGPTGMFPPMDQLVKVGLTLEDLESNTTPSWNNRSLILGSITNMLVGLLGSSALASFYSLQGLINTVQIFALILSTIVPVGGQNLKDNWKKLFLGTIPNVLALNFASVVTQSLLFLIIFVAIAAILLYYFYRCSVHCDRYNSIEGLQQTESKGKQWGLVIVTFLLTVIYLPLSTMAVHVLVWSEELWAIPNPYTNSTVYPPVVPALGPAAEFRDPLDFCWTTTMKRNEVNFAPIVVILAIVVVASLAIWFPLALRRVIRQSVPKVDKFTELGRPRNSVDMDGEYQRLLARDQNPFAFLYNGFRQGWGNYISTFLFAKLSTLVIVAAINPDNCLFRTFSRTVVPVVQQVLLLLLTIGFFINQCIFAPFLNPVNNASEWTSRLNYLLTSITALAITLNIPGKDIVNTYVLYSIYIVTYGLGFYFSLINLGFMQRFMKRLTRRVDFSIDIFSPRLDISPLSVHTKRRIWQESISTLLLTDTDCRIPAKQAIVFAQTRDSEFPPYLLDFLGTPGERHVENIKILREIGLATYNRAVALLSGPDFERCRYLQDKVQKYYIGPDSYWRKISDISVSDRTNYFGNAWWIPFPPTLVIRYDDGPYAVLSNVSDLEQYIEQNSSPGVQLRRHVRMSLRALEGQIVRWPYDHVHPVGPQSIWCWGRRYSAVTSTSYQFAAMRIIRRGHLIWHGLSLGSGFKVELKYARTLTVPGDVIGLNDDFDLTPPLARFLEINKDLIDERLYEIEDKLSHYRRYHRKECRWKARVLTYRFMMAVYNQPQNPDGLSIEFERDPRVQRLMSTSQSVFQSAYARMNAVSSSPAATWWYIFWDDLWRRNNDTVSGLQRYASDFNPHFVTSIAYTPLPRPALESFLIQRGLLHSRPRWNDFFHVGLLNKLYLRLNDAVFRDSSRAIVFHLGNDGREFDMEDIDVLTQGQSSTLGTGGGTDHDDGIRARPAYRWEGLLNDPPRDGGLRGRREWLAKLGAWFGVTPLWRSGTTSNGISLDVKLENGRYVLLDDASTEASTCTPQV